MRPPFRRPIIHKFGGAALQDAPSIRRVGEIFAAQTTPRVMVVSAVAGMTDLLLRAVNAAAAADLHAALDDAASFRTRHHDVLTGLDLESDSSLAALLDQFTTELNELLRAVATRGAASPAERDLAIGRGELLSAAIMSAMLRRNGEAEVLLDPRDLIVTDGPHTDAVVNQAATRAAVQEHLVPHLVRGHTPVVPGFLGRAPDGSFATLGRGGTDLTATLLARALDADEVILWKDVPGLMTADPRVVSDARLLPVVHRLEAAELAWYGARILHPRALGPLTGTRISVQIRCFATPDTPGTVISAQQDHFNSPVRGLAAVRQQTLLTISGSGIRGVPAIATKVFAALHARDVTVTLVAQASAETALDCTVPTAQATEAVTVLRDVLREDIQRGEIDGVERRDGIGIVAAVGLGMARHSGVAAKVFDALADSNVNVVAVAAGAGERNLSIAMDEGDTSEALRRIHQSFQLGKSGGGRPQRRSGRDVILLGAGTIGKTVLKLLADHPESFAALRVVAVLDSRGAVTTLDGFQPGQLRELADAKQNGIALAEVAGGVAGAPFDLLRELLGRALVRPILVDMTATDSGAMLRLAATAGLDLVLANKQPLAASSSDLDALHAALQKNRARLRYEATVGAGLPVVEALQQLLGTGDRIRSLEGCLSGTLGVVLTALQDGVPFSSAVEDARARGFTEPDPRDDLGGVDVARKALILARALGLRQELSDITIDSLVLRGADAPVDRWLAELSQDDDHWRSRAAAAAERGAVLRYVARITPDSVTVGLREIPVSHPLAQLRGAANQLVFTSDRYHDSPLVITGPGAGPAVTATGVLADLLALSR